MLRGALAAAVTPLRDGGTALDEDAFAPYVDYLAAGGLDGLLALGTTGEGILLSLDERRRAAELFVAAGGGRLQVAVHAGAQTTADTTALAAHAVEAGADAVAVIGPPYYALDEESLFAHFAAAAKACEPLPFYLYEFKAR
ncbi:MAG: dihydrodipicolinate synthase family protein, partial [Gaiellaceae bacterium]